MVPAHDRVIQNSRSQQSWPPRYAFPSNRSDKKFSRLARIEGVISTISGYTGGTKKNPTYEEVSAGTTGHAEAVQITYDPTKIRYEKLLDVFWRNIDPLTANAQFCDSGSQYRSAIFYHDET